jgi:uncharacterized protein
VVEEVTSGSDKKPPLPLRRRVFRLLAVLALVYTVYLIGLFFAQRSIVFPRWMAGPPGVPPAGVNVLTIEPEPGLRIEGWLWMPEEILAGEQASERPRLPLAVLFHGNAETIDGLTDLAETYLSLGFVVLTPEYRGYGRSGGTPSQAAITADSKNLIETAILSEHGSRIDASRTIYHGRSIGGGVACSLAMVRPPSALVLQSTFTSLASFSWGFGAPGWLVRDPFRNDEVLRGFKGRTLIFHGREDEIVPASHSEELARIARDATHYEMSGSHNNFPLDQDAYDGAIRDFVAPLSGLTWHPVLFKR